MPVIDSDAVLSPCGAYRYVLSRRWGDGPPAIFVMLNPSTADAREDDPTIRRCLGFARAWGAGRLSVVNLFALRSTDPRALLPHADPIGPDNDRVLARTAAAAARSGGKLVAAWGASHLATAAARARFGPRTETVLRLLTRHGDVYCLGTTSGKGTVPAAPRHPLYRAAGTPLELYRARGGS